VAIIVSRAHNVALSSFSQLGVDIFFFPSPPPAPRELPHLFLSPQQDMTSALRVVLFFFFSFFLSLNEAPMASGLFFRESLSFSLRDK